MRVLFLILACFVSIQVFGKVVYDEIRILVDDHPITRNEILIRTMELAQIRGMDPNAAGPESELREAAVNQLIEETLLDIRAEELMITLSDEELDDEINRFRTQRNISRLELEELLERQKTSMADFRKTYLRQIKRNRVIVREVRSKINIDEEELREAYENNAAFELYAHARHLLLRLGRDASREEVRQVKGKLLEIREKIISGMPFEEAADRYSEDPSVKSNHGDLGFFKKSDMVSEFAEAAFKLEPGEISEPVRTPFGFHLIELVEFEKRSKKSFDELKDKIMQKEYQERFEKMYKDYLEKLKKKAEIVRK